MVRNLNYGIAFRESALYRLALAGHKSAQFHREMTKDRFSKSLAIFQKMHVLKIPIKLPIS